MNNKSKKNSKKRINKSTSKNTNSITNPLIIDVSMRSTVQIENKLSANDDLDLEIYRKELEEISKKIEELYYSQNVIVDNVQQRRFIDLIKIFVNNIKEANSTIDLLRWNYKKMFH